MQGTWLQAPLNGGRTFDPYRSEGAASVRQAERRSAGYGVRLLNGPPIKGRGIGG